MTTEMVQLAKKAVEIDKDAPSLNLLERGITGAITADLENKKIIEEVLLNGEYTRSEQDHLVREMNYGALQMGKLDTLMSKDRDKHVAFKKIFDEFLADMNAKKELSKKKTPLD